MKFFGFIKRFILYQFPVHIIMLLTRLLPESTPTLRIRGLLLSPFFKKCGKRLEVAAGVQINHIHKIEIGNDVFIGYHTWINGVGEIKIEDEVLIGPFNSMSTNNHTFINNSARFGTGIKKPIIVGRGSWLAAHVVITAGTKISSGTLIAAGAVVTKDVKEKNTVIGGVPNKKLGNRDE